MLKRARGGNEWRTPPLWPALATNPMRRYLPRRCQRKRHRHHLSGHASDRNSTVEFGAVSDYCFFLLRVLMLYALLVCTGLADLVQVSVVNIVGRAKDYSRSGRPAWQREQPVSALTRYSTIPPLSTVAVLEQRHMRRANY